MEYLKNAAQLHYASERCIGCRRCEEVCPHRVFHMDNKKAVLSNKDRCMECGACARNCPANAITVRSGVGCAAAIMNIRFGIGNSECNCAIENANQSCC